MKCPYCGSEVLEGTVICNNCGGTFNNSQKQFIENSNSANLDTTGIRISEKIEKKALDQISVGICLLCLFIPFAGIIYFFINRKNYPRKSKAALICTVIRILPYIAMIILQLVALNMQ